MPDFLTTGPARADATLLLAHGAGAAMDSAFMTTIAEMLAASGIRVVRFEFGYMAAARTGKRGATPRGESLMGEYRDAVAALKAKGTLLIGGTSLGGRVASMVAEELFTAGAIGGLVCLGYPFHPPGDASKLRTAHLKTMTAPALICQGTRDPFGTRDEVPGYGLSPSITVHWLEDGDHDLKPRKAISGRTHKPNLEEAVATIASFAAAR
ncbi:MAG: alpha/beta family hydrolase [Devosia sp.]